MKSTWSYSCPQLLGACLPAVVGRISPPTLIMAPGQPIRRLVEPEGYCIARRRPADWDVQTNVLDEPCTELIEKMEMSRSLRDGSFIRELRPQASSFLLAQRKPSSAPEQPRGALGNFLVVLCLESNPAKKMNQQTIHCTPLLSLPS